MLSKTFKVASFSRVAKRNYATQKRALEGKSALVTGSTSGIGLAVARCLANAGANVMLNGFGDQNEINKLQQQLRDEFSVKVGFVGADVSKPDQVRNMVNQTQQTLGALDILVNNAGIQHVSPVEEFPEDKWDAIIAINLSSAFHATKASLPSMKKKGWGRVINIASVHGLVASAGKSAYVASKFGIVGFTKAVALETAGTGVTVNTINPGWVLTPLVEAQIKARAQQKGISYEEASVNLLAEKQPSKQFVKADDIGGAAVFLCSAAANQITGISLPVDGGWTSQ